MYHIILILQSNCMHFSLFQPRTARGEFHAIAVYTRQLQIHPCRKLANILFTAKTISLYFLNISYSDNYQHTHICMVIIDQLNPSQQPEPSPFLDSVYCAMTVAILLLVRHP